MTCPLCSTLEHRSTNPRHVADLDHGAVFLGERQNPRAWCVWVLKSHVEHLADLPIRTQGAVFGEVALIAGAVRSLFPTFGAGGGPPRINYECLGNQVAHIHWHVIPRYADDPDPLNPVWGWAPHVTGPPPDAGTITDLARRLRATMRR